MKLYINGDSHSAGAELTKDYCFAEDDPLYKHLGRKPHPDNLKKSYGKILADMLGTELVCEAESASSNQRIMRTTKEYINHDPNAFVVVGWTTWEREEWNINGNYYQISASGTDDVPRGYEQNYKAWVASQTQSVSNVKMHGWHKKIYDFHQTLVHHRIKHYFFNAYSHFDTTNENWGNNYHHPYDPNHTMYQYLRNSLYLPNKNHHHGEKSQREWADILFDKIRWML